MTDLREKVSQAIRISMHSATGRERDAANRAADAAIKAVLDALKEPSEAMIVAGLNVPLFSFEGGLVDIRPAWAAMLTAFTRDHYLSELPRKMVSFSNDRH